MESDWVVWTSDTVVGISVIGLSVICLVDIISVEETRSLVEVASVGG